MKTFTGSEPNIGTFIVAVEKNGIHYAVITHGAHSREERDNMTQRQAQEYVRSFGFNWRK